MMMDDQKWPEWLIQFPPPSLQRNTNNREQVRVESQVKQTNPLRKVNREHKSSQHAATVAIDLVWRLDSWVFAT